VKHLLWSAAPLALLLLSGCQSRSEGPAAAKVDGRDIPVATLDAELKDAPPNIDRVAYRKTILPQVIDRDLLAQAARQMGLDKTAEFAIARDREEQKLLIAMLAQKLANTLPAPTGQAIDVYIAAHPYEFAQRQKFYVDQIRFAKPSSTEALMALGQYKTLDALADALTQNAATFTRSHVLVDSAFLDPAIAGAMTKQPLGDPILVPLDGFYTANAIVQRMAEPLTGPAARGLAAEILRRKAIADALGKALQDQRKAASIAYQPGFQPAAKTSGTSPGTSKVVEDAAGRAAGTAGATPGTRP